MRIFCIISVRAGTVTAGMFRRYNVPFRVSYTHVYMGVNVVVQVLQHGICRGSVCFRFLKMWVFGVKWVYVLRLLLCWLNFMFVACSRLHRQCFVLSLSLSVPENGCKHWIYVPLFAVYVQPTSYTDYKKRNAVRTGQHYTVQQDAAI
jgi:hypothetical protein